MLNDAWPEGMTYYKMAKDFYDEDPELWQSIQNQRQSILVELTAYCYLSEHSADDKHVKYYCSPKDDQNFTRKIYINKQEI